ncbi:MAG: hypothetical protein CM1200mP41_00230 [Gammaproteobacteria bacterium]|nr:MAG: hypothetical protein CM1200mP41_00230 [Gammaproteobacteria bacterium]
MHPAELVIGQLAHVLRGWIICIEKIKRADQSIPVTVGHSPRVATFPNDNSTTPKSSAAWRIRSATFCI